MPKLLQPIPEGCDAIIGDIHGEITALDSLLARIEATPRGRDRTLVFVGDLIDRGPDSVAVVQRVADLVGRGRAVAVLGNHELNALLEHEKEGNGWYLGHRDHAQVEGFPTFPFPSRSATGAEKQLVHDFLQTKRFEERVRGAQGEFNGGLGALLWPEREVVFDDREETILAQQVIPVAGGG